MASLLVTVARWHLLPRTTARPTSAASEPVTRNRSRASWWSTTGMAPARPWAGPSSQIRLERMRDDSCRGDSTCGRGLYGRGHPNTGTGTCPGPGSCSGDSARERTGARGLSGRGHPSTGTCSCPGSCSGDCAQDRTGARGLSGRVTDQFHAYSARRGMTEVASASGPAQAGEPSCVEYGAAPTRVGCLLAGRMT